MAWRRNMPYQYGNMWRNAGFARRHVDATFSGAYYCDVLPPFLRPTSAIYLDILTTRIICVQAVTAGMAEKAVINMTSPGRCGEAMAFVMSS